METVKGQVVSVTRDVAGSTLIVDAVATDTVLFLEDVSAFDEAGGFVSIEGAAAVAYDSVDLDASTITLSAGLAGGLTAYETFVAVSPEAPSQTAEVLLQDGSGVTVPATVPQAMWALLSEGIREPEQREPVTLLLVGDDWTVYDVEFRPSLHDATTTPIVVSNADGESAQVDADGFSTYTNDPVPLWTFPPGGPFISLAADSEYLYAGAQLIAYPRKYVAATGEEITTGGWPLVSAGTSARAIAADGTYVYTTSNAPNEPIRKFDADDGTEILTGFPIAGAYSGITTDGSYIYAVDGTTKDIRKFNASTGAEVLTGFPITGTFRPHMATDGTHIFAVDDTTKDIRKFDVTTGVENTSGFPIVGDFNGLAMASGVLYAAGVITPTDPGRLHKFDPHTGLEETGGGWPLDEPVKEFWAGIAANEAGVYAVSNGVRAYNTASGYRSTLVDSSSGLASVHRLTATEVVVSGDTTVEGAATIDYQQITWTKARKTAAQTTGTGTGETLGQSGETYGAFDGSGTSGDTAFWTESNGVFTILEDGVYDIEAFVSWASNATGYRGMNINVSSVPTTSLGSSDYRPAVNGQVTRQSASCRVALSVGDTVSVAVVQTSGGNLNVDIGSYLAISRVGALAA